MVQKYLLVASSLPRCPPECTKFFWESVMAGVVLQRATLCIIVINPFETVHYMVSEKHKEDITGGQKVYTWHASGIMLATHKSIPATRFHEYGIDLGANLGTRGSFSTLKKTPGELQAWRKKGKRGLLSKPPWFFSGKFLSLRLREVKSGP